MNVRLLHNDTMSNRNDFGSCLSLPNLNRGGGCTNCFMDGAGSTDGHTDGRTSRPPDAADNKKTFSVPRRDTRSGRKEEEKSFQNAHHNIIRNARTEEIRYYMITRPEDAH